MKAFAYTQYGSPDVVKLQEIEKPTPSENQVLIKVNAASVNPLDWHLMRGAPFLARLEGGLFAPKDTRIGADVAGVVEAVGANVKQFHPGDEVYGVASGSFADYALAGQDRLALKPINLSFEQTAAMPVAALTALQGLRDKGKIRKGQRVLINGAAGGVGTFAVQVAKSYGTHVTGVCSTPNLDMVRSIGADDVIDYTREDFVETAAARNQGQGYDLIFDAVGNRWVSEFERALAPDGYCSIAGFTDLPRLFQSMLFGGKQVGRMATASANPQDLDTLRELAESGKITPVIDRCYPLSEVPDAIRYLETGHARGKVAIAIAPHNH